MKTGDNYFTQKKKNVTYIKNLIERVPFWKGARRNRLTEIDTIQCERKGCISIISKFSDFHVLRKTRAVIFTILNWKK